MTKTNVKHLAGPSFRELIDDSKSLTAISSNNVSNVKSLFTNAIIVREAKVLQIQPNID